MRFDRAVWIALACLSQTAEAQNYYYASPTGGNGAPYTSATAQYFNGNAARCQCFDCNGNGLAQTATFCRGPSEGCSVDDPNGCFGQDASGTGGDCQCQSGQFSNPESNELGGIVSGLQPNSQVTIASSWTGAGTRSSDTTQTIAVNNNGQFTIKQGQGYEMAITRDPESQKCTIDSPKGIANQPQTLVHITCKTTGPIRISTTGCTCVKCNGGGTAPMDAFCSGRSIGCTVGNGENSGCFGVNHNYVTGRCSCGSGKFSHPEKYAVSGTIFGLYPGQQLVLGCSTLSVDASTNGINELTPGRKPAVQTVSVDTNGQFVFPYRFTKGQNFKVSVVDQPVRQQCAVRGMSSGIAGNGIVAPITVTCTAKMEPGAQSVKYEQTEQARDQEYSGNLIPTTALTQQSGGGMILLLLLAGGAYAAHQNGMLDQFMGSSVSPYTPIGGETSSSSFQGGL